MTPNLSSIVDALFAGGIGILEREGHRSGIFKRRLEGEATVTLRGIVGDEHADSRVHGGPGKAVHHYAAGNYPRLADHFPAAAQALIPGSLGENISSHGLTEDNVHIGDVFRIGGVLLQVSQPRSPCWKINHRFGIERMSVVVAREFMTGWYYRVLEPGRMAAGDKIELLERQARSFSITDFWKIHLAHRPGIDDLLALSTVPGLAQEWQQRLTHRAQWLQKQGAQ